MDAAALTVLREFLSARDGIQHMQQLNRRYDHGYVGTQLSIDSVVYGRQGARSLSRAPKGDARVFERALFVPKDQDNNGLYFLGATTGSGKNYTAEQVTADLIAGGWDESGCFNKCPGRRTLVFVVPGKDNRDNYVANVRQLLADQGMDSKDAERMVFDLPRAGENILHWIEATRGKGAVGVHKIPCPIEADDERSCRVIKRAWRSAMEVADDLLGILDTRRRLGSVVDRLTPSLWEKLSLADASLRWVVSCELKTSRAAWR